MTPPSTHLTSAQTRLLKALEIDCDAGNPPTRLLSQVPPRLLAQWLRSPPFRRRLRRLLQVVRHRREVSLCLASARAAERLSMGVEDATALDANQRRICVDLIRLARASSLAPRRAKRSTDRNTSQHPPESPIHPDVPPEELQSLLTKLSPTNQPPSRS